MFTNMQRHILRHPTSIALTAIVNWVTADGCVHITESVGSCREVVANSCTHHRCDATQQFRRVGVGIGGVYWALELCIKLMINYLVNKIFVLCLVMPIKCPTQTISKVHFWNSA